MVLVSEQKRILGQIFEKGRISTTRHRISTSQKREWPNETRSEKSPSRSAAAARVAFESRIRRNLKAKVSTYTNANVNA